MDKQASNPEKDIEGGVDQHMSGMTRRSFIKGGTMAVAAMGAAGTLSACGKTEETVALDATETAAYDVNGFDRLGHLDIVKSYAVIRRGF